VSALDALAMDLTGILLGTTHGESWSSNVDLAKLSLTELEALVQKARDATLLLEAELENRCNTTPAIPPTLIQESWPFDNRYLY